MFISREIVKNVQVDNQYYSRYCMKFRLRHVIRCCWKTTRVIHTCFTWKENCYYWLLLMSHTFSHFCFLKRFLVLSKSWFNFFPPVVCISRSYFFILLSPSKVIGSTTSEDNFLTLLKPTYVMPNVCSDFPLFTHAFGKVNPWLLWIVRAHASLSGSCYLSWNESPFFAETVTGAIATKEGISWDIEGPI